MKYDVLTIDSNVAIRFGCNFESGMLAQLAQLKSGPTFLAISEVILGEIRKHLADDTKKSGEGFQAAIKKVFEYKLLSDGDAGKISELAATLKSAEEATEDRLKTFLSTVGAEVIPCSNVGIDDLLRRYFEASAPFEATGKKKSEFPDALALMSLEIWARENGLRILAVSADTGWDAYANTSEVIDVVGDLGAALETIQSHLNKAVHVAARALREIGDGSNRKLKEALDEQLANAVAGLSLDADAEAPCNVEADDIELEFAGYTVRDDGSGDLTIIQSTDEMIVVRVDIDIRVTASASFSFSVKDWVDKDDVLISSRYIVQEKEFEVSILFKLLGNFSDLKWDVAIEDVEIVDSPRSLNFGYLEPYAEE